jgi:hypothetical protein
VKTGKLELPTYMKKSLLSIIFLIAIHSALAQDKDFDLVAGIGFPEMLHIGFNADISPKSALGFNAGANTSGFEAVQVTIEHKFNFASSKKFEASPTWYFGQRLAFFHEDNSTRVWRILYLTPVIGRHVNISDRFGLNLDLGIFIILWEKTNRCSAGCDGDERREFTDYFSPTGRLQIFYRI